MTTFDMLFFFAILIGVLIGIACGVHIAFTLADGDDEDDSYLASRASKTNAAEDKNESGLTQEEPKEKKLSRKQRKKLGTKVRGKQTSPSYADFECQFTDEDPADKLQREMKGQESSYNYLNEEKTKK